MWKARVPPVRGMLVKGILIEIGFGPIESIRKKPGFYPMKETRKRTRILSNEKKLRKITTFQKPVAEPDLDARFQKNH